MSCCWLSLKLIYIRGNGRYYKAPNHIVVVVVVVVVVAVAVAVAVVVVVVGVVVVVVVVQIDGWVWCWMQKSIFVAIGSTQITPIVGRDDLSIRSIKPDRTNQE